MSLVAKGVGARFGGVVALDGVDIELSPGEVLAVIGPNGSGKSTLFNCITGFVQLSSGVVHSDDEDITGRPAAARIRTGIARTFQTPRIDPDATVLHSVMCGYLTSVPSGMVETSASFPRVRRAEREIERDALSLLEEFDLLDVAHSSMGALPMGQVRLVDVLRAVAMAPQYLLLDEPAAGLAADEQERLKRSIRDVAERGIGVLLVEHNFGLVREVADRVAVLQKGRKLVEGTPEEIASDSRVVDAYLGVGSDSPEAVRLASREPGGPLLKVEGLTVSYGRAQVCHDVKFDIRSGEIVALLGPNGAGKSSLLAAIAGVRLENRRARGRVELNGVDISEMPAARRPAAGLALVPEGRGNIFAGLTVEENLQLGLRGASAEDRDRIETMIMETFPALPPLLSAKAGLLSGGEQQMVSIALALANEPNVLMLDEPTQGLAPAILDILVAAFSELRDRGLGLLLAEQNQAFAALQADRFLVLNHGEVVASGTSEQLRDRSEIAAAYL